MRNLFKTLALAMPLAMASPLFAQDSETPTEQPGAATPVDPGISMGEEATDDKVGETYIKQSFEDWHMRCVHAPEGQEDPCQLYQLLNDETGNPVAEISIFTLPESAGAAAGATIVTPLETLLTQQVRLSVDSNPAKRYPFSWCSAAGCFARIGFTPEEISGFKRGAKAKLTIVPVVAPDQTVDLTLSLKGFTAGYDALVASN
ncbi:MAG: invasion-associated locus B family protein [Confluentimicrobium sp.]|jgi:invasion protein IalB|uniref:invasion associated locus B family protein n=1 Tax=Actibacterium sp. TaxID=1872125 RepID=UPI000C6B5F4F|nr:invasion associated locus B family protein [Actibacterium sp.]MBC57748.1 invasion-associated locus B family protein [Actibacterium sp.]MDY6860539.1 invasion associated locus B family protein [Pseudomonadota bacterium]|tara:strand:- start:1985 stop:2593 length:609 start_codon:yes stop_codon:yes gene_type:complete